MEKEENLTKPSQSQNEDNTSEQETKNSDGETEGKVEEKSEITPEQKIHQESQNFVSYKPILNFAYSQKTISSRRINAECYD